ncbi:MAG: Ig-like domain-containing protein, partial [Desulfobacterales bacterium]|nr:Ig-like domain-containing protein [Desulfobacterales bacterium]
MLEKSVTGAPKTYSDHAQFSVPSWVDGGTNKLVFVVEATDASNQANAATESKIVFIYKDKEPRIKSLGSDEDLVKGGPSLWEMVVEDDFSTADKPLVSMGCVTSLSGLGEERERDAQGIVAGEGTESVPVIEMNYPEGAQREGRVLVGGEPLVEAVTEAQSQTKLRIYPQREGFHTQTVRVVPPEGFTVSYDIKRRFNEACLMPDESKVYLTDQAGVDLATWLSGPSGNPVNHLEMSIHIKDDQGESQPFWLKTLLFDAGNLGNFEISLVVGEGEGLENEAIIKPFLVKRGFFDKQMNKVEVRQQSSFVVPPFYDVKHLSLLAHAVDRYSTESTSVPLPVLLTRNALDDEDVPELQIIAPTAGRPVAAGETLNVKVSALDNSGIFSTLSLFENGGRLIRRFGGVKGKKIYTFHYTVSKGIQSGEIELLSVAEDESGNSETATITLPLKPDLSPTIALTRFRCNRLSSTGAYLDLYETPERLNYGEFWVRPGSDFEMQVAIADDLGLKQLDIYRVEDEGTLFPLKHEIFDRVCPDLPVSKAVQTSTITFRNNKPTEYLVRVKDIHDQISERTILIHPLENIPPQIRITTPAPDQAIVAGSFRIKVGVVVADDRPISSSQVHVYANGKKLLLKAVPDFELEALGGEQAIVDAYEEISQAYIDIFKSKKAADAFGKPESPHSKQFLYVMDIPQGLLTASEPVTLKAVVEDSEKVFGRHEIIISAVPDGIKPDISLNAPTPGASVTEGMHVDVKMRAFDNVKVDRLQVFTGYSLILKNGEALAPVYGDTPTLSVHGIEARDHVPVTTEQIDTPLFTRSLAVKRLSQILNVFPGYETQSVAHYLLWVKLIAVDASGNSRDRALSFPVLVDESPSLDIVSPLSGSAVVEGGKVPVRIHAHDDVGIDSVRLRAVHGDDLSSGVEIFNTSLRQPPWQFSVAMPVLEEGIESKKVHLVADVVDTYGDTLEEAHRVTETSVVTLEKDRPPVVSIAKPSQGETRTEGEMLLVQVSAVDDIGVGVVELRVEGLISGDRVYSDSKYPYEFLIEIPYGQSNKNLSFMATATEIRYQGEPRRVSTATPTIIHIASDDIAPEVKVLAPAQTGAVGVEKRALHFAAEVDDNVKVSSVSVSLLYGGKTLHHLLLTAPPYHGAIALGTLEEYLGDGADGVKSIHATLRFYALDGAGNHSQVERSVEIRRNTPPSISAIQLLDARGYNLGDLVSEITEGREVVVNVLATDPEAGIDTIRLYQSLGEAKWASVGSDTAAPFQFHIKVPTGLVGDSLKFCAEAVDLDGYISERSQPRSLTIAADVAPKATLIEPSEESVFIKGEPIRMTVETWDDLGPEGIDRVLFFINGIPARTVFSSMYDQNGAVGGEMKYQAVLYPPEGALGFLIHAVAYDVKGQIGESEVVQVGVIEDTVKPKINLLYPNDGEILTQSEPITLDVAVEDMGPMEEREVHILFMRQGIDPSTGEIKTLASDEVPLTYLPKEEVSPHGNQSDPDNAYYLYTTPYVSSYILTRQGYDNERVKVVVRVSTKNHTVTHTAWIEIGLPIAERHFLRPSKEADLSIARSVYHSTVEGGADGDDLLAAWSTADPARLDPEFAWDKGQETPYFTGLYLSHGGLVSGEDEGVISVEEQRYVYSALISGAQEILAGTITDVHLSDDATEGGQTVLVSKAGCEKPQKITFDEKPEDFVDYLAREVVKNDTTGGLFTENHSGELLVYSKQNGNHQFGLPWFISGRVDMPYKEVYGVCRSGNLALVANGHGGVQVIQIGRLSAPYHVGYIKPFGYARDVLVKSHYAVIAASHEGVVLADLSDPSLPIISSVDTLGVAHRLDLEGNLLYVTNLAGDGTTSNVTVVDLSDPFHPEVVNVLPLVPSRRDFVSDGVYDVMVSGGRAYATVLHSDQEDKPAQSLVEMVSLADAAKGKPGLDCTTPVVVHRKASPFDFAPRSLTLHEGGLVVGGSQKGLLFVSPHTLAVASHFPGVDQEDVLADGLEIEIDFTHTLQADAVLKEYVVVMRGSAQPGIGVDVTDLFSMAISESSQREVVLSLKEGETVAGGEKYFVTIKKGLSPESGYPLTDDYTFGFLVAKASGHSPKIIQITPSTGSIEGHTLIQVSGKRFSNNPSLAIGGQELQVTSVGEEDEEGVRVIEARTVPNYAGPAAVTVTADNGLSHTVVGGFTYVDILKISYITPSVVRVDQEGGKDRVEIVGYGFHDGIILKAWKSGQPKTAVEFTPANDASGGLLTLYSSEKMSWYVPGFDGAYRGFVDVEIRDGAHRYLLPKALFYGRLEVSAAIETGHTDDWGYDSRDLPPGHVVDLVADPEMNLIYVLGRGFKREEGLHKASLEAFHQKTAPGWLSLVKYDEKNLENAAPMHGLGYYNTPQALEPVAIALSDKAVYVSARGENCPYIDVPFENKTVILVYERLKTMPDNPGNEPSEDRTYLFALPLPFHQASVSMTTKGSLLFAALPNEGVAVISIVNPEKPSLLRVLSHGLYQGKRVKLNPASVEMAGEYLMVSCPDMATGCRKTCHPYAKTGPTFLFDIHSPTLPQVSATGEMGLSLPGPEKAGLVSGRESLLDFGVYHIVNGQMRLKNAYQPEGFHLSGKSLDLFTGKTLAGKAGGQFNGSGGSIVYLPLFDTGLSGHISLLDAAVYKLPPNEAVSRSVMLPKGIMAVATRAVKEKECVKLCKPSDSSHLLFVDTMTLDLRSSTPEAGAMGVSTHQSITLRFTETLDQTIKGWVENSAYLALVEEDGSASGIGIDLTFSYPEDAPDTVRLAPVGSLKANTSYRIEMRGIPSSRRTQGLFDLDIPFSTGAGEQLPPEIVKLSRRVVSTTGGAIEVWVKHAHHPLFLVGGESASSQLLGTDGEGVSRYQLVLSENSAGPATLIVKNESGGQDRLVGALLYAEPLFLQSASPAHGNVHGGTLVTIHGRGFTTGDGQVTVFFGDREVSEEDTTILDDNRLQVVAPVGTLGSVDIRVTRNDGQSETLESGFTYLQPPQSEISDPTAKLFDLCLNPSGTYLSAAAGPAGVTIYNIDPSAWINGELAALDPNALRDLVDLDGNGIDDRIVSKIQLPDGYWAIGVADYFERGVDRLLVTAVKPDEPSSASLFVVNYPEGSFSNASILYSLALEADLARGVEAKNSLAAIALGTKGLGLVDIHLQTKAFVMETLPLPGDVKALDVAHFVREEDGVAWYAVAAGPYDLLKNALDEEGSGQGGLYLVKKSAQTGLLVVSSVSVPCSAVAIQGHKAYLAAGSSGLVVVDLEDVAHPRVQTRMADIGAVYDVAVSGHTAYLAMGSGGMRMVDISDPESPKVIHGMMEGEQVTITAVVAGEFSAIGGGGKNIVVTPDTALKVHTVLPENGLISDAEDESAGIWVRFNKSIDNWPANLNRFDLLDAQGATVPFDLSINNNDAKIYLEDHHSLSPGDRMTLVVREGVSSVDSVEEDDPVVLYRLERDLRHALTYI